MLAYSVDTDKTAPFKENLIRVCSVCYLVKQFLRQAVQKKICLNSVRVNEYNYTASIYHIYIYFFSIFFLIIGSTIGVRICTHMRIFFLSKGSLHSTTFSSMEHGSKQEVTKVVSLCKKWRGKRRCIHLHLGFQILR